MKVEAPVTSVVPARASAGRRLRDITQNLVGGELGWPARPAGGGAPRSGRRIWGHSRVVCVCDSKDDCPIANLEIHRAIGRRGAVSARAAGAGPGERYCRNERSLGRCLRLPRGQNSRIRVVGQCLARMVGAVYPIMLWFSLFCRRPHFKQYSAKSKAWYRLWIRWFESTQLYPENQGPPLPKTASWEAHGNTRIPSRPSRTYTHLMAWNHCRGRRQR
jgi:hypothetical protein